MVFIGMIFQYDSTQGTGLIMLSDGEKKEFSSSDWTDTVNSPNVGQKVSYENDDNRILIKLASQDDIDKALKKDEDSKEEKSLDDYLNYYVDMGFKLVKDEQSDSSRIVTLRSFTVEEYSEAIIKQTGSKVTVAQTLNGKPLILN